MLVGFCGRIWLQTLLMLFNAPADVCSDELCMQRPPFYHLPGAGGYAWQDFS